MNQKNQFGLKFVVTFFSMPLTVFSSLEINLKDQK